ncbi:tRNA-guanine transglycosylase DpdA [Chloroflexota bacterium]
MTMKFFFADSLDQIDPGFDFIKDQYSEDRQPHRDDYYPHEFFKVPPYDGILVSRAVIGDLSQKGKYTTSQSMRFKRDGARAFLRYYPSVGGSIMGDSGAFSYIKEDYPPYNPSEMVDYYTECGFTHGVSIDHVILGYNEQPHLLGLIPEEWKKRFDITLELANEFMNCCKSRDISFQPIGVAQGWSPKSYSDSAQELEKMGYQIIAIGGLVPLQAPQIHNVLIKVRNHLSSHTKLHLFGFSKVHNIGEFTKYGIESFDSTSPMIRAFKDARNNYLFKDRWYSSIRIPSAEDNPFFKQEILAGRKNQEKLRYLEKEALDVLRLYAGHKLDLDKTIEKVIEYGAEFSNKIDIPRYREVLRDRPWEKCECEVCSTVGIEVIVFRGANRNRRRGFHNLWEFYRQLQGIH